MTSGKDRQAGPSGYGSFQQAMSMQTGRSSQATFSGFDLNNPSSSGAVDPYLMKLLSKGQPTQPRPSTQPAQNPASTSQPSRPRTPVPSQPQQQQHTKLSSAVCDKLGQQKYTKVRSTLLRQQTTFTDNLYDLHKAVQVQKFLVRNCGDTQAWRSEVDRLQGKAASAPSPPEQPAAPLMQHAVSSPYPYGVFPMGFNPYAMPPGVDWQMQQQRMAAGTPAAPCMDPMAWWYGMHYGNAHPQAPQQQDKDSSPDTNGVQSMAAPPPPSQHWWQDARAVFGAAGSPHEVLAAEERKNNGVEVSSAHPQAETARDATQSKQTRITKRKVVPAATEEATSQTLQRKRSAPSKVLLKPVPMRRRPAADDESEDSGSSDDEAIHVRGDAGDSSGFNNRRAHTQRRPPSPSNLNAADILLSFAQ